MNYFTHSLLGKVNDEVTGREIENIWHEHEDGETLESRFVLEVDKFKLILQMLDYERAHEHNLDLGDFSWVASMVELPEMTAEKWDKLSIIVQDKSMIVKCQDLCGVLVFEAVLRKNLSIPNPPLQLGTNNQNETTTTETVDREPLEGKEHWLDFNNESIESLFSTVLSQPFDLPPHPPTFSLRQVDSDNYRSI